MTSEKPSRYLGALDFLIFFKTNLCFMFVIVFSLSSFLLCLPNLDTILVTSSQSIQGAFASIFVHKDFTHLIANALLAFAALIAYSISNTISDTGNDNFIVLAMWISALLANLAYVKTIPYLISFGSSGLVSALLCGVTIISYMNAWVDPLPRVKVIQFAIGTFLFGAFIALNLNVNPDTNVAVHLSSFSYMAMLMLGKRFLSSFFSKTD